MSQLSIKLAKFVEFGAGGSLSARGLSVVPRRARQGTAVAALLITLSLPWVVADPSWVHQILQLIMMALLISSLNLSFGNAGEFALSQVVTYAVGAYAAGYASIHWSAQIYVTIPFAIACAVLTSLIIGAPALRLGGWSLGVVSLFVIVVVPNIANLLPDITGGMDGLLGIPARALGTYEFDTRGVFVLATVIVVVWFSLVRNFLISRHGNALKALRQSPQLTASLGVANYRLRLTVYLISAIPAGLAGALFSYVYAFVSPLSFTFQVEVSILVGSMIGGLRSIYGPIIGAAFLQFGPVQADRFEDSTLIVYGLVLVIVAMMLPGGVSGLMSAISERIARGRAASEPELSADVAEARRVAGDVSEASAWGSVRGALLDVRGVSKSFGGVRALDDVTLQARPGEVTAIIGANGSGKTTLLNVISGFVIADNGAVQVDGKQARSASGMARLGVRRTFQTPVIPEDMDVAEVTANGRYWTDRVGILPTMLRLPRARRVARRDRSSSLEVLAMFGIGGVADEPATTLPLGIRRIIEVARAVVGAPTVLLLDEPAAGLEADEIHALAVAIERLRTAGLTVILVEHNFGLVRRMADVIHVLDRGQVIAVGTADEVACDEQVRERYFGGYSSAYELEASD